MQQLQTKRFPVWATLATLVVFVTTALLGVWQWQRAEEKQLRLDNIEQKQRSGTLSLSNILTLADPRDTRVRVNGQWLSSPVFFIDNKVVERQVGYDVIAIMQTTDGLLAVNLGWVVAPASRQQLPQIELNQAEVSVMGMVQLPVANKFITETAGNDKVNKVRLQQVDLTLMQEIVGQPLLPLVLMASDVDGFQPRWKPVVMPPQKHIAYAVQWFGLSVASLAVYFFAFRSWRKQHD